MNGYLRQSTASQSRLIGPFVSDTDFKTAQTSLTIANTDIKLRANGTTLSNKNSGGGTHQANGTYSVTWDATDTANVGELFYVVSVSGALLVWGVYTVLEEAAYDAMFAASAPGYVVDQPVNATKLGGTTQTGRDIGASVLLAADQAVNTTKFGGTTVTGRDIGASVLLSSGTGAGQIDFTSGVVKANLAQILGTALTETAGQIAAAFKKFFDKASPTGTINSIPDAVAGAASGLALVGSNVGTATSVTGAVGSVTAGVTVTTNNDKTGYALSTAGVKAIWDQLTSALTTAGSIGKKLTDWVLGSDNKSLLSTDSQAGVTIPTVTTLTNAPSDSSGVTTLLSRLSALRAGYLDNLSAGAAALESSLQSLITTIGVAGAGLTATASAVWSVATRLLTAGTNIVLAKGTGVTGFNDLSAAEVNAEVDTALADYDGPTHTELAAELATADDAVLSAIGSLNNLSQANVRSAVGLSSANLDTQLAALDHLQIEGFISPTGSPPPLFKFIGLSLNAFDQGQSSIVVGDIAVDYNDQYQGMSLLINDTGNSGIVFAATIKSSIASSNTLILSRPIPDVGAIDLIPALIVPLGAVAEALILYEGS